MALMENWSLRRRTLFLGVAPAFLMLVLLLGYLLSARLDDAQRELAASGGLMSQQLAASADYAIISGNVSSLSGQVDALLRQPGVVEVRLLGADGTLLLEAHASQYLPGMALRRFGSPVSTASLGTAAEDWLAPATVTPTPLGRVEIGISDDLALVREHEILRNGLLLGALALMISGLLALYVEGRLRRPLEAVAGFVERLGRREFEDRVEVHTGGEIGQLGQRLNELAAALADARDAQAHYTRELLEARVRADEASQAKSQFLAMMSHELRTPLNGVAGMLQLLEATRLDAEQADYVQHAHQAGADLLRLVDDILDFSRLEQGRLILQPAAFDPVELLSRLVARSEPEAQQRHLALVLEVEGLPEGCRLVGDVLRLRQVLGQLVENALKFTSAGSVTIRAVFAARPGRQFLFTCEICDTGIGVPQELQARIFEPFMQADSQASRRFDGAGLGLAIAARLTAKMDGRLRVESEPGVGSCFIFELLLPCVDDAPVDAGPWQGVRVLVVEDNPANQQVAEGMLRHLGCEVVLAADGEEALGRLAEGGLDLVLMDCQLPVLDGFEATRRWRARETGARLPVIALTAHQAEDVREACQEAGMDAVLTKPFRRQALTDLLGEWLVGRLKRGVGEGP